MSGTYCGPHDWWYEDGGQCRCCKALLGERERIIKLLEDECAGDWPKVIEMSLKNLIALINGENK